MKLVFWCGVAFVGLLVLIAMAGSKDQRTWLQRGRDECDRQFGQGTDQATSCALAVAINHANKEQAEKLKAAVDAAQ